MAKIIVQEKEIEILTIWENIHNLNFNYGEFAVIKSQEVLNKIAINQMRILSGGGNKYSVLDGARMKYFMLFLIFKGSN